MTTNKIAVEVPIDVDQLLKQLNPKQQQILSDKLWAIRIERISQKLRSSVKKNKITQKEIRKWCEEARKKVYEKYHH
jgi:hypothetical protein